MAYLLRALTAFSEDPGSGSQHPAAPNCPVSTSRGVQCFLLVSKGTTHAQSSYKQEKHSNTEIQKKKGKKKKTLEPKYLPLGALYYIHTGWLNIPFHGVKQSASVNYIVRCG